MQTITSPPFSYCCFGNRTNLTNTSLRFNKPFSKNTQTHFRAATTLSQTHSRRKEQRRANGKITETDLYPNYRLILHFFSYNRSETSDNRIPEPQNQGEEGDEEEQELEKRKTKGLFANMWWADFKAALGQRFNSGAILCSVRVVLKDRSLALPHVSVRDISHVDWSELRRRGFEGVVFDKDNTITAPYSLRLWGPLAPSIELCKAVFGPNIAVFSNSAGLFEYDHDGSKARALESAIGIKVIRHRVKKPAGTAEEIEKHFGCDASQLIMVGDRPLTDIVYGNMNGFLTILTGPLTLTEEPFIVRQVRKLEKAIVKRWSSKGLNPTPHKLLPDASQCVFDPPIG